MCPCRRVRYGLKIYMSAPIRTDIEMTPNSLEITRILGKIDITLDQSTMESLKRRDSSLLRVDENEISGVTSIRIYEGVVSDSKRCYLKEYLPVAIMFGKTELRITRKLTTKWNSIVTTEKIEENPRLPSIFSDPHPPFSRLFAHMTADDTIESIDFRQKWRRRFPGVRPPEAGNLWLAFEWDDCTFRSMRNFAPLPQIIEGFDYFRKDQRVAKRWMFLRKMIRKSLEAIDFVHGSGYCHNAVNIQSLWLSTTNQQNISSLSVQITDLGAARKLADDAMFSRQEIAEDMYYLGLGFLELIIASFSDDNVGARQVRQVLGIERPITALFPRVEDFDQSQISQRELQQVYEKICESDIVKLRSFVRLICFKIDIMNQFQSINICRSIIKWKEAFDVLEADGGAAWKLIFKMLARGSLYDEDRVTPIRLTGRKLVRESAELFKDTYMT